MIKKYDKLALMHISIVFGLVTMFLVQGSSESGLFTHLSYHAFEVRNFRNRKSMWIVFFKKMFNI